MLLQPEHSFGNLLLTTVCGFTSLVLMGVSDFLEHLFIGLFFLP